MDEPTTGAEILDYIDEHGLKRLDACYMFGISPARFGKIIAEKEQEPLNNPSMAILYRLIREWPEQGALPEHPKPREVFERARAIEPELSARVFAMALGCNPTWATASRLDQSDYSSAVINRLLWLLMKRLDAASTPKQEREVVRQWIAAAVAEWHGRNDNRLDFFHD